MIIKKAEYITSGTRKEHFPASNLPEFVFLGRSNVGKSSFINAITNRKNLAYTSSKPGKTITLNFYNVNDSFLLVDVPGYGYAIRTKADRENYGKMIEEYLEKSDNLVFCFLVVDSRHIPTEDDVLMYKYLKFFKLKVIVIATKVDKISKNQRISTLKQIKQKLELENDDVIISFSAISKEGLNDVYQQITDAL